MDKGKTFFTKASLFQSQAPCFNFELDATQILALALKKGFITPVEGEDDLYLMNEEY